MELIILQKPLTMFNIKYIISKNEHINLRNSIILGDFGAALFQKLHRKKGNENAKLKLNP